MSEHQKSQYQVGIGLEATRGQKSSALVWYPVTDAGMNAEGENKKKKVARGKISSQAGSYTLKQMSRPKIDGFLNDKVLHVLLKGLLGGYAFAANDPATGANTHTFTPQESNLHPSFTVVIKTPIKTEMALGCMISSMGITLQAGEICVNSVEFEGMFPEATTETPSYLNENDFTSDHVSVKLAADLAALSGASASDMEEITLEFNKNTSSSFALGDNSPKKIFNGNLEIKGTMKALYENDDFYDQWKNSNSKALGIYIENTDNPITGSTYPKLEIEIADFTITEAPNPDGDIDTISRVNASFEANQPFSVANLVTMSLINDRPTL